MALYWKDALKPGVFYPPALGGEPVEFTPADLRRLAQTGNDMIAAGWHIPVCYEHDKKAVPFGRSVSPAEQRARGYCGKPKRYRVGADGRLEVLVEVDDDDARQVEKIGHVSPYIGFDVRTGDGRLWRGPCIEHIAVTPIPVNPDQRPFRRLHNAAGVALSLSDCCRKGLALSLADYGGFSMAEETLTADDTEKDVEADTSSDVDDGVAMSKEGEGGGDKGDGELAALLESNGLYVPADMMGDLEKFKTALVISLKTKMANGGGAADEDADELPDEGATGDVPAGAEVANPAAGAGGGGDYGLSLAAAQEKLVGHERAGLERRLHKLLATGRVTPYVHDKLKKNLAGAKLALSRAGDLEPTDVATRIAAYEENVSSKVKAKDKLALSRAGAKAEDVPEDMRQVPQTEAEAQPVLDGWAAATGTLR